MACLKSDFNKIGHELELEVQEESWTRCPFDREKF